jgi:succinate dehydrogenase / fumarate reductase flavoprotein subunit
MSPVWRKVNLVCSLNGDRADVRHQPLTPMRDDLLRLFDRAELEKYLTEEELPGDGSTSPATPEETH